MKTPPFLIASALLLWGWQTGFILPALIMGVVLEASRWIHARWDLSDEDFSRIWVFCTLLFLGAAIYAFTANDGPADFRGLFQNPNFFTQRNAGAASARTAASLIRWLPMLFFIFIAAQAFCTREGIPLETISLLMKWRRRKAKRSGLLLPRREINLSYPYFALCLFAASAHGREDNWFFWSLCVLLVWALWGTRARRYGPAVWAVMIAIGISLGYTGQRGIGHLQRYLEGINAQWLSGFTRRGTDANRNKTALGQIGRIKTSGKIMIRVEPLGQSVPPYYLREASYRSYRAQTWYSGTSKSDFETVSESLTNRGNWLLLPPKTNTSSARIACYLDGRRESFAFGLVPLASGSCRVADANAFSLFKTKSGTGAVLAEGPALLMFTDEFGAGPTIDSIPDPDDDTHVPPREKPALRKIIGQLPPHDDGFEAKLKCISQFFQNHFNYSTWQEQTIAPSTNETPLARFLLHTRSGHCEYFATATVLLLRELGIHARYAVGYVVHESTGKKFVVRQRDAHAWCLVWNEEQQHWQDFDTTPSSWIQAENRASWFQVFSDGWSRILFEFSRLRYGHSPVRQYFLWSLIPVLAVLLYQILARGRRQRLDRFHLPASKALLWPGLDSEFYTLEAKLSERIPRREAGQPLSLWLERALSDPAAKQVHASLQDVLQLHYRYRFDPQGLKAVEREQLRLQANACLLKLKTIPPL